MKKEFVASETKTKSLIAEMCKHRAETTGTRSIKESDNDGANTKIAR